MSGSTPVMTYSNSDSVKVSVPAGEYAVVVFNESFEDFDRVVFRDIKNPGLFSAYTATVRMPTYTYNEEAEPLASWYCPYFVVDEEMISTTRYIRSGIPVPEECVRHLSIYATPRLLTTTVNIRISVIRLKNIISGGGFLTGFAEALRMYDGLASDVACNNRLSFVQRQFINQSDGYLILTLTSFGLRGGETECLTDYTLDFRASLLNGYAFMQKFSLSDSEMEITTGEYGETIVNIDVGPITIPDVQGEEGWDVTIGDWDGINVPVPIR